MNFLAHIYLSGDNDQIKIGNFVADGIRGRKYHLYPLEMQVGILLHREIDTFTDAHAVFRKSTKLLHKNYGHYSGVIVDIFYDHFLAKNWHLYSDKDLKSYVHEFYESLNHHMALLPTKFQSLTPVMIEGNWLLSYASIDGIQLVLNGMNRRTKHKSHMNEATKELLQYYNIFEDHFTIFFKDLMQFSEDKKQQLISQLL